MPWAAFYGYSGMGVDIMRPVFLGIPAAAAVRWSFRRHLRREIAGLVNGRLDTVLARSSASSRDLVRQRSADVPDAQGLVVVTFAAAVLAAFRTLVDEGIERPDAYEAVRKALMATWATPVRWSLRGFLSVSRDPVGVASRPGYLRVMRAPFGRLFRFDHRTTADRADLIVTGCGFHRVFVDHGEPLLTRIMCEWDHTLFNEMNSSKRSIRMSCPATISTGCGECVFRHERSDETELLDIVVDRRSETLALLAGHGDG